jgi:hypothetical protein
MTSHGGRIGRPIYLYFHPSRLSRTYNPFDLFLDIYFSGVSILKAIEPRGKGDYVPSTEYSEK